MPHQCPSCQLLRINGVACHESGCPDAWQDTTRDCEECGGTFEPEERGQRFCGTACYCAYYGLEYYPDEDA